MRASHLTSLAAPLVFAVGCARAIDTWADPTLPADDADAAAAPAEASANAADGNAADGDAADGDAADGNAADGHAADGNAADGDAASDAATDAGGGAAATDASTDGAKASPDGANDAVADVADVADVDAAASDATTDAPPDAAGAADTADAFVDVGGGVAKPPCLDGPGFAAFRFHYAGGSTSPTIDAFGLPDSSNFEATPVYSTSIVDQGNGGGLEIASGNWILIRYSVVGLAQIQSARFSVYGRSYDTSASASFEAWTPLYGSATSPVDSVSNAWTYAWTTVDFTGFVQVGDAPGLTGIRLYARGASDDLAIHAVELCIDGS